MSDEIWKTIEEVPHYSVSNLGKVRNDCRGRMLKPSLSGRYASVTLVKNNKAKLFRNVHRLVAIAFIPNPNNLPCVNHKDEDTWNNKYDNLEWCTKQYNTEYSLAKSYQLVSPSGEVHSVFNIKKFCKEHSLNSGNIFSVIHGRFKQSEGWTYKPNKEI